MAKTYTYDDVLKNGRLLGHEDGYRLICDRRYHYRFGPANVLCMGTCMCWDAKEWHSIPAKPRFEVYNKDADFFWDHQKGAMFWLKISSGVEDEYSTADPSYLVEKIVDLLNRSNLAECLMSFTPITATADSPTARC
jgi:hypothetical protein